MLNHIFALSASALVAVKAEEASQQATSLADFIAQLVAQSEQEKQDPMVRTVGGEEREEEDKSHNFVEKALTNQDMGLLSDYGCWCYFEANHGAGRGHPIDELDSFCKTLHDGYECILFDSTEAGSPCIPWEIPYTSAFGSGFPSGISEDELSTSCDTNNAPDSCAAWTCKVEGFFAQQFFLYATSGGTINNDHRHANGFEPKQACPTSPGPQSDKSCCGHYPRRGPFKTYDGNRSCCNGRTYNTAMFSCCLDANGNEDKIAQSC